MQPESDEYLVRYLLGELSDGEAEQLDERGVTDEALARRLRLLEDDLVDRYARGETLDVPRDRFDRARAASPHLQEKVLFARALQSAVARNEPASLRSRPMTARSRLALQGLAAAAVLLLAATGYLAFRNLQFRDGIDRLAAQRAAAERQSAELQQQLDQARAAASPQTSPDAAAFVLRPPRRGPGDDTTIISVPRGTEQVTLLLVVEAETDTSFWAAVRAAGASRIVWRTPDLPSEARGRDRVVTLTIAVKVLERQRYLIDLFGLSPGAASSELVSQYPIRIVLE